MESAAPNRPVVDMHLVKYTNKKQRAALSNSLLNGDGCCDMAGTVGIHAKGGTLKGIAHKVDEFGGETGRRRAKNTRPWKCPRIWRIAPGGPGGKVIVYAGRRLAKIRNELVEGEKRPAQGQGYGGRRACGRGETPVSYEVGGR